jgi:hypothetical protein
MTSEQIADSTEHAVEPAVRGPRLVDLSAAALERIRAFTAAAIVKSGFSPADVADVYTAPEIVADRAATEYLDQRFVLGELPPDWRHMQDDLTSAYLCAPPGTTAESLLTHAARTARPAAPRSIFDDPDDLGEFEDDEFARLGDHVPELADLSQAARHAIERHIVSDALQYGLAPYHAMALRQWLQDEGDERSLQYLDLVHDTGSRPSDWEALRQQAVDVRKALEQAGVDPARALERLERSHAGLGVAELLATLAQFRGQ